MADLHSYFMQFNKDLELTASKAKQLKTSEQNIKKYIKKYFEEKHSNLSFKMIRQGSFVLETMIRNKSDKCDVDFGLRFFPIPKNLQPITLQKYVKDALTNVNNSTYPIHKKKCIRLEYKKDYHIDVTVYGLEDFYSSPKLATKDGWEDSDPSSFKKWFFEAGNNHLPQLKRVVKYLKAWSNYKGGDILKGVAITILAAQNFVSNKRDDISLFKTASKILDELEDNWECLMPVSPYDDLLENMSETSINTLYSRLTSFVKDADKATLKQTKETEALRIWKKHLGKYFNK